MVRRSIAAFRRWASALGRAPTIVLCIAAATLTVMYCSNDNLDDHPDAPRGDGKYRPVLARGDGHMHYLFTRSLVFDGDVNLDNDLARFGDPWNQPRTVTGRKNVMQQIGPSLIWAPVLLIARGAGGVANWFGADIPTHGYTMFHQRILFATSVVFGFFAVWLGVWMAKRLLDGRWGPVYAGVAVLLGTSLTYYATYMPSYAHAMDAAAVAGFLAYWYRTLGELRWKRYVWLGVLLGTAAMVRIQDVGFGIVLAFELIGIAVKEMRGDAAGRERAKRAGLLLARGGVVLGITVLLHVPQFYVWKQYYGAWLTTPQGPGQMRYGHPMILELLFSSRNGYLSTHPIAYLGMIGLAIGTAAGPRLGPHVRLVCGGLLAAVAIQVYVNAVTYEWWSGASFGQRRMCSSTLPHVVGLATLLRALHLAVRRIGVRGKHVIAIAVLGWFVVWNMAWVGTLRHGHTAGRERSMCCDGIPGPMRAIAEPIYRRIGNPFALPASALYAVEHGVGLDRWDKAVGTYALVPPVLGYIDGSYRKVSETWDEAGGGGASWLLDGWSKPQAVAKRKWRWTTASSATMLLPLLMPEPHRITMPIAANAAPGTTVAVTVKVNGEAVAHADVGPTWQTVVFDTDGTVGDNEIEIDAEVAPYRIVAPPSPLTTSHTPTVSTDFPTAPPNSIAVGVAIGPFRVALP